MSYPTLIKPPPPSGTKAPIEDVLELTHLEDINPNLFTNTRPLWHPPGARGIYGGAAIAQCLAAAQRTVPKGFLAHSMHCYFVLNGNSEVPVIYHVERVREGRSFATRTVQARQRGQPIFTTTISFMRAGSGGKKTVSHAPRMPEFPPPLEEEPEDQFRGKHSPFVSQRTKVHGEKEGWQPQDRRTRQWIKAKGKISDEGGYEAHTSALAYMSDSYFIGTVSRVHKLWRFTSGKLPQGIKPSQLKYMQSLSDEQLRDQSLDDDMIEQLRNVTIDAQGHVVPNQVASGRPEIGMMVSLDHTIYFHNPQSFRADDWIFTECQSPWAGDGRGLVHQRMYTRDGVLIATCIQEGLVRLKQDTPASKL
ncbi:Thioesterase/thiol ester dehydrase-isomerase [Teratosphaeria nubilosa]|uniref:Thioesterase/thiol ester dehydrase-isomerase n=1 Tax=Teratosphaeria nubilosa TaxID=161662 RepID=A0A6G1L2B1_9PEZI|nr:Thioesterase/thiol ester dehydrase-isomerase [Teratosphaeria nubilosa]